jgi:hypothetical protein
VVEEAEAAAGELAAAARIETSREAIAKRRSRRRMDGDERPMTRLDEDAMVLT